MSYFYHFLERLGLDFALMLAGLFGGVAFVSKPNDMSKWQKLLTIVTGVGCANYLTPLALYYLNLPQKTGFAIAFLLGFSGLKTIELIINRYESRTKKKMEI